MSAAPQETAGPGTESSLRAGTTGNPHPAPAQAPAPSLSQLLGHRTGRVQAGPRAVHQPIPQPTPPARALRARPLAQPVIPVAPVPQGRPAAAARPARPETRPQARPDTRPQAPPQARGQGAPPTAPRKGAPPEVRPLREPTFDELVSGYGRHRGPQELPAQRSLLGRLAVRARLVPTPARRPPARATGDR